MFFCSLETGKFVRLIIVCIFCRCKTFLHNVCEEESIRNVFSCPRGCGIFCYFLQNSSTHGGAFVYLFAGYWKPISIYIPGGCRGLLWLVHCTRGRVVRLGELLQTFVIRLWTFEEWIVQIPPHVGLKWCLNYLPHRRIYLSNAGVSKTQTTDLENADLEKKKKRRTKGLFITLASKGCFCVCATSVFFTSLFARTAFSSSAFSSSRSGHRFYNSFAWRLKNA